MSLRLVKTTGGNNGSPDKCKSCGSTHFVRSRIAWNCSQCGSYVPINLRTYGHADKLQKDLEVLTELHKEFKRALDDLERIVTE